MACSPAPRASRPPRKQRCGEATAGVAYDHCYHQACDNIDNINLEALDINADAIAYAVLNYAMNTQPINGEPGKGNFRGQAGADDEELPTS